MATMIKIKARKLTSFFAKAKGLMFSDKVSPIYFETRFGIHTLFVKTPIDILVLDKNFVVRKLKEGLAPWRIFVWNPNYYRLLELPPGCIKKRNIRVGSKIRIEFW
jgi:uncharacterized membrane protein (UPF0127 family)